MNMQKNTETDWRRPLMGTDINIVEAQNDLKTVKKQAEQMQSNYPAGTYMNTGLGQIIGTINERLDRWNAIQAEEESEDIIDMEVDIQDEDFFAQGGE